MQFVMKIEAVLFDMDGTLVDSEGTHHRALSDVLDGLGLAKPAGFDAAMTGQSLRAVYDHLVAEAGLPLSYAELATAKYRAFLDRIGELHWRPGAQQALAAVAEAGCAFAVVTNSDRMLLDASLKVLGLTRPDLTTVSRNDVREGKPQPEPYLRAAWLLGLAPARCLVVEDSQAGATAGLAAGMTVIGWPEANRPDMSFGAGALVAPPHDLVGLLGGLL